MATRSQIIANRRNGRKGGVKTAKGKAVTRLNALKHGILSNEAIIRRGDVPESEEEYRTLSRALVTELKPVGSIERLLVDLLLLWVWKFKRVVRAERAGIETATIGHIERDRTAKTLAPDILLQGKDRWDAALNRAKSLAEHMETIGFPLADEWEDIMLQLIGEPELSEAVEPLYMAQHLYKMQKTVLTIEDPMHAMLRQKAQKAVEIVKGLRQMLLDRDEHLYRASAEAAAIGSELSMRYMTMLFKHVMQTLHELERQQAKRLGYHVPLSTVIDVIVGETELGSFGKTDRRSLTAPSLDALGIGKMALGRANLALKQ